MKATLEMALEAMTNPSVIAVQHAVELIRQALAQPEQEPVTRWFDCEKYSEAPPRKEWVGLTDADLMKEFGYTDELLRDTAYRVQQKLKELNG